MALACSVYVLQAGKDRSVKYQLEQLHHQLQQLQLLPLQLLLLLLLAQLEQQSVKMEVGRRQNFFKNVFLIKVLFVIKVNVILLMVLAFCVYAQLTGKVNSVKYQ